MEELAFSRATLKGQNLLFRGLSSMEELAFSRATLKGQNLLF